MSVINQMLKDLDDRKREDHPSARVSRAFLSNQDKSGQKVSLVKMISLIVFIIFLVVLITTVTIYKFDLFNANQDATIESKIPIGQVENVSEQSKKTDVDKPASDKTIITAEAKPKEQLSQVEEVAPEDSINSEQEVIVKEENNSAQEATKIVKSSATISLKDQSEKLFNQAQINLDSGNSSRAKQQLSEALKINIKNHKGRILLLTILLSNGEIEEMQQLLDSSLNQWPAVNEYRQLQARLYLEKGLQQQALNILQQDIPAIEESVDYHALLAFVAQQLQQDKLASKHFRLLLQVNNSRADWWLGYAVSEERLGNKEIALQAYNQSIRHTGLSEKVKNYARQRIKIIQGY